MEAAVVEQVAVQEQPTSTTPPVGVDVKQSTPPPSEVVIEKTDLVADIADDDLSAVPDSTSNDMFDSIDTNGTDSADANGVSDDGLSGEMEDLSLSQEIDSQETPPDIPKVKKETTKEAKSEKSKGDNKVSSTTSSKKMDSKSSSGKSKKKEDKSIEHILRALNSLQSTEEKLAALCKKYADLHEEHRVVQASFKQAQRKMVVVAREKDQLQSEHTKAVMAKSKLESLCRELQKHNRVIKEESLARAREEDEKRREISNKFQQTITDIQAQMTDNHERNIKLREDNTELAGKLKKFVEQYELREQQVEKIVQHRDLEKQLGEAKLNQANAIMKEHEERAGKEREFLLLQAAEAQKKSQVLETQLTMYKERYEEFQSTINRSNEMFGKFKTEMDKMGKRIKKLEKEGAQWKAKWEGSNRALIGMVEDKTKNDKENTMLRTKVSKLESLCRALQSELHGKKTPTTTTTSETDGTTQSSSDKGLPTATPPNTPETTSRNSPVKEDEVPAESGETTPPVPTESGEVTKTEAASVPQVSNPSELDKQKDSVTKTPEAPTSESDSSKQPENAKAEGSVKENTGKADNDITSVD